MYNTESLYIYQFGPITEATVFFRKFTVMIGEQGAGKCCIAKSYSLFSWLEKSLMRNLITEKSLIQFSRFRTKYAKYNGIDGYFNNDTRLVFTGCHYEFRYKDGALTIAEIEKQDNSFSIAKVMYVPAERCILGSFDHPTDLKNLKSLNEPI